MNTWHLPIKTTWGTAYIIFNKQAVTGFILPRTASQKPAFPLFRGQLNTWLKKLKNQIIQYFHGKPVHFTFPFDLSSHTPFERKVLTRLMTIEYGKTISYKQLAEKAGHPRAYRAAGTVMAGNNIPLLIPCHRVIKSDGATGSFGPGPQYKRRLLHLEKII